MSRKRLSKVWCGIAAMGLIVSLATSKACAADADFSAWSDSVKILMNTADTSVIKTVSAIDSFPVLVRLRPDNFPFFSSVKPGGADIRFGGSRQRAGLGGVTFEWVSLPYEIERYVDGVGDNDTADIWVKVYTILPDDSTQFFTMYFGNADAVDSSNGSKVFTDKFFDPEAKFLGVWHLNESASGTGTADVYQDRSSFGAHGTDNVASNSVPGLIGNAVQLDGTSDHVDIAGFSSDSIEPSVIVSAWIKPEAQTTSSVVIAKDENGDLGGWGTGVDGGFSLQHLADGGNLQVRPVCTFTDGVAQWPMGAAGTPITANEWHFVTLVANSNVLLVTVDGVVGAQTQENFCCTGWVKGNTDRVYIGRKTAAPAGYFKGLIDEVRVARMNPNSHGTYISLSYVNQRPDSRFVTISDFSISRTLMTPTHGVRVSLPSVTLHNSVGHGGRVVRSQPSGVYDMYGRKVRSELAAAKGIVIVRTREAVK